MLNKIICAAMLSTGLGASAAHAEDAPKFFVHAGLGVIIFNTRADVKLNGSPGTVPNLTGSIDNNYTLLIEGGYMLTPKLSASLTVGLPPLAILKAAGPVGDSVGDAPLGGGFYGPATLALQYHLPKLGPVKPYVGGGLVDLIIFKSDSRALQTFKIRNDIGGTVQIGGEIDLTRRVGVFVSAQHMWLDTRATWSGGLLPAGQAQVRLDPTIVHLGLTYRF